MRNRLTARAAGLATRHANSNTCFGKISLQKKTQVFWIARQAADAGVRSVNIRYNSVIKKEKCINKVVRDLSTNVHKNCLTISSGDFLLKGIIFTRRNGNLAADQIGPKPVLQEFNSASAEQFLVSIYSTVQLQMFVFP